MNEQDRPQSGGDGDDIPIDGILPPDGKRLEPTTSGFRPWHKPRKQHVRRAWACNVRKLMESIHVPAGSKPLFRYLTLPGEDMLDVMSLKDSCEEGGFRLHYLGFNASKDESPEEQRLTLAHHQMKNQGWVDEHSHIAKERLENITARRDSIAYKTARDHGPYHAVNIDLCGNIASHATDDSRGTCLDALLKIIQLQTDLAQSNWLLFIATRVKKEQIAEKYLKAFVDAIRQNAEGSPAFAEALNNLFTTHETATEPALLAPMQLPDRAFKDLFCVGLSKWLLHCLQTARPAHGLRMLRSYYFSVCGGEPDMLSLVFRVERSESRAVDPTKIVDCALPPPKDINVEQMSLGIIKKTTGLVDLDAMLRGDTLLHDSLIKETAELLKEAHYDVTDYPGWAYDQLSG